MLNNKNTYLLKEVIDLYIIKEIFLQRKFSLTKFKKNLHLLKKFNKIKEIIVQYNLNKTFHHLMNTLKNRKTENAILKKKTYLSYKFMFNLIVKNCRNYIKDMKLIKLKNHVILSNISILRRKKLKLVLFNLIKRQNFAISIYRNNLQYTISKYFLKLLLSNLVKFSTYKYSLYTRSINLKIKFAIQCITKIITHNKYLLLQKRGKFKLFLNKSILPYLKRIISLPYALKGALYTKRQLIQNNLKLNRVKIYFQNLKLRILKKATRKKFMFKVFKQNIFLKRKGHKFILLIHKFIRIKIFDHIYQYVIKYNDLLKMKFKKFSLKLFYIRKLILLKRKIQKTKVKCVLGKKAFFANLKRKLMFSNKKDKVIKQAKIKIFLFSTKRFINISKYTKNKLFLGKCFNSRNLLHKSFKSLNNFINLNSKATPSKNKNSRKINLMKNSLNYLLRKSIRLNYLRKQSMQNTLLKGETLQLANIVIMFCDKLKLKILIKKHTESYPNPVKILNFVYFSGTLKERVKPKSLEQLHL